MRRNYFFSLILSSLLWAMPMQSMGHWAKKTCDAYVNHYNELMLGGLIGSQILGIYILSNSGDELSEGDAFKDMVHQEFRAMGLDGYPLSVRVSAIIEDRLMITTGKDIIVAKSLYDAYFQENSDKDVIRFLVRHEASHINHSDVAKKFYLKLALYVASLYGVDYLFAQLRKHDYLPGILDGSYMQFFAKGCALGLTNFMSTYVQAYEYEMRADRDACCSADLAEGGSRCFARLANFIKEQDPVSHIMQSNPFLYRWLYGYPTFEERSKTLHAIAQKGIFSHINSFQPSHAPLQQQLQVDHN